MMIAVMGIGKMILIITIPLTIEFLNTNIKMRTIITQL